MEAGTYTILEAVCVVLAVALVGALVTIGVVVQRGKRARTRFARLPDDEEQ